MTHRGRIDYVLFGAFVLMTAFGLVMVYSASSVVAEMKYQEPSWYFLGRQAAAAAVAFFALMYISKRDYRALQSPGWAFALLGGVLFLLVLVYFTDAKTHRWLRLGITQIQPSELAKPALIIFLAYFVTRRQPAINNRHTLGPAGLALAILAATVVVADLGTAVVLMATAAAVFYVAGLRPRYFLVATGAAGICLAIAIAAKPYRMARIIVYFDPEYKVLRLVDPDRRMLQYAGSAASSDSGYQARQSLIAVGSGGLSGEGLMDGRQKLLYLPEAHTDFIYAVVGEELGLIGCAGLLAGFLVILWRGYRIYWIAADDFGRYLAVGIATSLVFQALMNMTVVLDLMPTKGIPLPLVSYGGSSLVSSAISLGVLLSVSERAG